MEVREKQDIRRDQSNVKAGGYSMRVTMIVSRLRRSVFKNLMKLMPSTREDLLREGHIDNEDEDIFSF